MKYQGIHISHDYPLIV